MECMVLGFTRLSGTSKKSGNPYDFYVLGIAYQGERGYTGQRVREINVDPADVSGIEKLTCPFNARINIGFDGRVSSIKFI